RLGRRHLQNHGHGCRRRRHGANPSVRRPHEGSGITLRHAGTRGGAARHSGKRAQQDFRRVGIGAQRTCWKSGRNVLYLRRASPDLPDDITGPLRVSLGPPQSYPHPGKPSPSFPGSFFLPALSTRPLTDARFAKRLVRLQTYMRRSPLVKSRTFAVGRKWAAELTGVLCVVLLFPSSRAAGGQEPSEKFDLVILHGRVMDPESGLDAVRNIAIKDGKIRAVTTDPLAGKRTVD